MNISQDQIDQMKALKASGFSDSDIARQVGVGRTTVRRHCKGVVLMNEYGYVPRANEATNDSRAN